MFKNKNIKAIIFDLDDTLYPEKEFVISGFQAVAEYLARKYKLNSIKIFNILKSDFEKGVRGKNFNLLLGKLDLPKRELKKLISVYRNHKPKIKLYSDADKILRYFNKKIKIGLISDGIVYVQKNKIKALEIGNFFDTIILSDSFGKKFRKPNPKPFKTILKKMKIKPEEAIYIADNPQKDFIGAKKLGIATIRIKRAGGVYTQVKVTKRNEADFTINSLIQLKKYV